jgi:hypothetical protein
MNVLMLGHGLNINLRCLPKSTENTDLKNAITVDIGFKNSMVANEHFLLRPEKWFKCYLINKIKIF